MIFTWKRCQSTPSKRLLAALFIFLGTLCVTFTPLTTVSANQKLNVEMKLLNEKFQQFSLRFYEATAVADSAQIESVADVAQLESKVITLADNKKPVEAILTLYRNRALLENNPEHSSTFRLVATLLHHNELNLATHLLQTLQNEGDHFQQARIKFIFARYYADQLDWQRVQQLLENTPPELSATDAEYAYLLQGKALQQLKQHRPAQNSYEKIPSSSRYYRHARLNLAIAQIRQDWLTEASSIITGLISEAHKRNPDEFTNRLHLVLGYAQLQKDYYRSARESFGNISLDSTYINRALLGIAMCVTNLGEFENALNTLSLLKQKNSTDLSVEESYLLIPYVYEKLDQEVDVATTYTEAMTHYQNRINDLNSVLKHRPGFDTVALNAISGIITIKDYDFAYGKQFPLSYMRNYEQLLAISAFNRDIKYAAQIEQLVNGYEQLFQALIAHFVQQRIEQLNSYLSQARFGLARLYDKSRKETE